MKKIIKCKICNKDVEYEYKKDNDSYLIDCLICGTYEIDGIKQACTYLCNSKHDKLSDNELVKLSTWISEQNKINNIKYPIITNDIL